MGTLVLAVLLRGSGPVTASQGAAAEDFYRLEELHEAVALDGTEYYVPTVFGPTGMVGWILGSHLIVRDVEAGSPADGRIRPSDVLFAVNGEPLGEEPLKTLGLAIDEAEKTGRLPLGVMRGGKRRDVELQLRKLGGYGKDWPFRCEKSATLLLDACAYLDKTQNLDGGWDSTIHVGYGMNGMVWLASDDPRYLENARRLAWHYRTHNDLDATGGTVVWGWGYMGMFLAEYYLKTGDTAVLDLCGRIAATLAKWQQHSGTWGHGPNPNPGYVQGGSLNNAAVPAWIALMLIRECGVPVDEGALAKADRFFSKYIDRGGVPYGNHRPEFFLSGNGKDAMASVAFAVKGDRRAAEVFARMVTDGYRDRHRGHTGGFMGFTWGNVAGANNPHHPDYRRMLDYWRWLLDVSRRWDGGFLLPHSVTGLIYTFRGPILHTGAVARLYGLPRKNLRIVGAPRSIFAAQKLPASLTRGLQLYRDLQFGQLEAAVKPDGDLATQLLRAAEAKRRDIELSIEKARAALQARNPILARHVLEPLDAMCRGREPRVTKLLAEARSDRYAPVFEAEKVYDRHKWLASVYPKAREELTRLAGDPRLGIVQKLAQRDLAADPDATYWGHYCEVMWQRYSEGWQTDELRRHGLLRILAIKSGNWPRLVAERELRGAGALTDAFLTEWTALVPAAGVEGGKPAPKWRLHPLANDAPALPDGWAGLAFDDSGWKDGSGPVTRDRRKPLAYPRNTRWIYIRIPFSADTTDFAAWRAYFHHQRHKPKAVVYLNGSPIAWLGGTGRGEYRRVDLLPQALRFLRRGRNVLAVRALAAELDIGLYARRK